MLQYKVRREKAEGRKAESCSVTVEIQKYNKDFCAEFSRYGGSSWLFYEHFKIMKWSSNGFTFTE